jgi:predicted enzyme related to lactoylglutathione lyase
MPNPVVHFEVLGKDAERLQGFYRDAFAWKVEPVMPQYAMAHPTEDSVAGGIGSAMDGGPGHVTFYVGVPDLDASLKKIESLGGKTVAPPMEVPGGPMIAMFADPEGHVVGLVKTES